jgi:hypothetical protein
MDNNYEFTIHIVEKELKKGYLSTIQTNKKDNKYCTPTKFNPADEEKY